MNVCFANGWFFGALKFSVPRTISGTGRLPGVTSRSHSPKGIWWEIDAAGWSLAILKFTGVKLEKCNNLENVENNQVIETYWNHVLYLTNQRIYRVIYIQTSSFFLLKELLVSVSSSPKMTSESTSCHRLRDWCCKHQKKGCKDMKEGKAPRSEAWLRETKNSQNLKQVGSTGFGDLWRRWSMYGFCPFFFPFKVEDRSTTSMFFCCEEFEMWDVRWFCPFNFCWSGCFLKSSEEGVRNSEFVDEAHIPDADFSIILSAEKMLKRLAAGLFLNSGGWICRSTERFTRGMFMFFMFQIRMKLQIHIAVFFGCYLYEICSYIILL